MRKNYVAFPVGGPVSHTVHHEIDEDGEIIPPDPPDTTRPEEPPDPPVVTHPIEEPRLSLFGAGLFTEKPSELTPAPEVTEESTSFR